MAAGRCGDSLLGNESAKVQGYGQEGHQQPSEVQRHVHGGDWLKSSEFGKRQGGGRREAGRITELSAHVTMHVCVCVYHVSIRIKTCHVVLAWCVVFLVPLGQGEAEEEQSCQQATEHGHIRTLATREGAEG